MRDAKRIDVMMERLSNVWKDYPDLRLGQLILNVASDPALYYMEDSQLLDAIEDFYTKKPTNIFTKEN